MATERPAKHPTEYPTRPTDPFDLVGIGIGPFNLALAALADPVRRLQTLFLDDKPGFSWHPGMMVAGARQQVPFLADLVSLVDPTSRYSYLAALRDQGRLVEFYFSEQLHVPRIEYEAYCAGVAARLPSCRFDTRVTAVSAARLPDGRDGFAVSYSADGQTVLAANVVLGIGTEPWVPEPLRHLAEEAADLVCHSAHYGDRAESIQVADDVTVLGSGQCGAEVVLDLLRTRHRPGRRLRWLTGAAAIEPTEYSNELLASPGRLYQAAGAETLAEIRVELDARSFPDGPASTGVTILPAAARAFAGRRDDGHVLLDLRHTETGQYLGVRTERLILATGYTQRTPHCLAPIDELIARDAHGLPVVGRDFRVELNGFTGGLYLQNAELHSHGVGTPDLGLGAYRAATVLNAVAKDAGFAVPCYRLPQRIAHTAFDPAVAAASDPGLTVTAEPGPAPAATIPPPAGRVGRQGQPDPQPAVSRTGNRT